METSPSVRRLVMVGVCYVDTILSVPSFPAEDHKQRASSLVRRRGGNVANSLEVLQQLFQDGNQGKGSKSSSDGVELVLLCVLPRRDSLGAAFVRDSLASHVWTDACVYRDDATEPASSYIIASAQTGSRTIVNYNALPEMTAEEFRERVRGLLGGDGEDDRRTWFHFEGREVETSVECLRWLRQEYPGKALISVEVEKPNRAGLERMAAEADVVFFSRAWADAMGCKSAEDLLTRQARSLRSAALLCCTWGAEGAAVMRPADGFFHHDHPALSLDGRIVDTVGAGDTFNAGMLYQLVLSGAQKDFRERAKEAVAFANRVAGRKVQQEGFRNLHL